MFFFFEGTRQKSSADRYKEDRIFIFEKELRTFFENKTFFRPDILHRFRNTAISVLICEHHAV